ncbi:MAG: anti-sigma factor [Planctomycetota bacterium]
MTRLDLPDDDRFLDLLVARATVGLDEQERVELGELLVDAPEVDAIGIELAAAAVDVAFMQEEPEIPLPSHLRSKVAAQWQEAHEPERAASSGQTTPMATQPVGPAKVLPLTTSPNSSSRAGTRQSRGAFLGGLGIAAALAFAVFVGWQLRQQGLNEPGAAERRDLLLAQATDVVRWQWKGLEDPAFAQAGGDVIWSSSRQDGYMTLRGLPANDPSTQQYQLWIVDPGRDEKHPVDGGVFDVPSSGEIVVPIAAKLAVDSPAAFALTLEQPGGVVVSAGPLLTLAQP